MWIGYKPSELDDNIYENPLETEEQVGRYAEALRKEFYKEWFGYLKESGHQDIFTTY